jgi:Tol biopolymer transport system component
VLAATIGPGNTFVDVQRARGLWRVPFLGGAPKEIVERINTPVGWSPDGQRMAFVQGVQGLGQSLVVANVDGGDPRVVATRTGPNGGFATGLPGAPAVAPAWPPDGRMVATLVRISEDVRDLGIVVFDATTHAEQTVKVTGDVVVGISWLNPKTLVVAQALEQGTPSQLWRVSFPDGRRTHLTNDVSRYADISISADADSFVTARPDTRVSIWVGDDKGTGKDILNPSPFLSYAVQYAMVGWDGPRVVFSHTLNGRFEIFRANADGSGSPDPVVPGRDLAVAPDGSILYRSITAQDLGLWKVDRDGRNPVQLAKSSINFPMVTPDGRTVLFSSPVGGVQSLWQVPLAGGSPSPAFTTADGKPQPIGIYGYSDVSADGHIAIGGGSNWTVCDFPACSDKRTLSSPLFFVRWVPDGKTLSFLDRGALPGVTSNLWMRSQEGSLKQVTHFTDGRSIGHYAWSRDGRLALSRASFSSDIVLFKGLKGTS